MHRGRRRGLSRNADALTRDCDSLIVVIRRFCRGDQAFDSVHEKNAGGSRAEFTETNPHVGDG